jgi:hypothetical protein
MVDATVQLFTFSLYAMSDIFQTAAEIRLVVGYLTEQHASWVTSQFFGPRAAAFLSPVFARTTFQAQCNGVTGANVRLHDEIIGVGRTHHLFRLPEVLEQGVAAALAEPSFVARVRPHLESAEMAQARLQAMAIQSVATEGAINVPGNLSEDADDALRTMAGLYADAFAKGFKTYPFVREA